MLSGGIPKGYVVGVIGSYGLGKTTLGLHFIYAGLRNKERGIIISFDEDENSILESAKGFKMDFEKYSDLLKIIRLEAEEVKYSLSKIENEFFEIVYEFNAERVVIDTISVLETLFDNAGRYKMLSSLRNIMKTLGVTAMITSEVDKNNPNYSKYGILEYICDGLIALKLIRKTHFDEPTFGIEVVKMRRVNHSRKPRPYTITEFGISVFEEAEIV